MKSLIIQLGIAAVSVIAPLQASIIAVLFLIFTDLVMGLVASYKTGVPFTSSRLKNTAVKALVYNVLLISGFVTEIYLIPFVPFTKLVLMFLGWIEVKSLAESFLKITGSNFIEFIKTYLNEKLNKTNKDENTK